MIKDIRVGIRPKDGFITLSAADPDGGSQTLTVKTDGTIAFWGKEVPMQDYETIPLKFRHALQNAFPKLIIHTVETKEPAPFEPEFDLVAPVEIPPTGDLIPVDTSTGEPRTDARALHASLGSKRQFGNWFDQRKVECDLVENQDYGVLNNFVKNPQGGRPTIDYWLTLDAAKEMAVMERNEHGKRIRRYLIDVEKKFRAGTPAPAVQLPQTYIEALRALADTEEKAQQLKIQNLAANQVIGETRAQLVHTEIKLETAEDQVEILLNKIELSV